MAWYEIVKIILEILGLVGALIPTIVAIVSLIKNIVKEKNWKLIEQIIKNAMSAVEAYAKTHPEMTSDDKLNMCLEAVKAGLEAAGISFDENLIKQIIAYIEELCSWSKTINCGK